MSCRMQILQEKDIYKNFQNEFEKLLQKLSDKRTNFKIVGDYNIDFLRVYYKISRKICWNGI